MALILDTGALIAFERGDREVGVAINVARRSAQPIVTSSGCVAQAWRGGGPKQAVLARLLQDTDEVALSPAVSRFIGRLCAAAGSSDVIDAHVSLLAKDGDIIMTSDPADIEKLLQAAKTRVAVAVC